MATNATATASSSSGSRAIDIIANAPSPALTPASTAESSVEPKQPVRNPGDSCTWYAGGSCYAPRSCGDCINTMVQNDAVRPCVR
ncbi:hypothetical protein PybrP1_007571 [[Pythium] brassicae (nom. inval.)]|nr:hypothetical protein PybrP1_007571 [[Pythium] brassicae (nom. inval.)]